MDTEKSLTPESPENPAVETSQAAEPSASTAKVAAETSAAQRPSKFCSHCGGSIDAQAVVCPLCGCQVEQMAAATPNIVINNANTNTQTQKQTAAPVAVVMGKPKSKWVAVLLCLFLGVVGGHKFYEGKVGMGILYLCTGGLCGFGALVDFVLLLLKPDPYYV